MTRGVAERVVPRLVAILDRRLSRFFLDERRRLEPFLLRGSQDVPTAVKARDAAMVDRVTVWLRTFDWDAEARILRSILRPAYAVAVDEAVRAVGDEIGTSASFDLNARQLRSIEAELSRRIVAITDRSRDLIAGRIVDGIEKGLSIRDITLGVGPGRSDGRGGTKPVFDGIRSLVDGWGSTGSGARGILGPVAPAAERQARRAPPLRSTRAFLIAQTETGNAFNLSAIDSYASSGLVDFVEVFDGPDCGWERHDDPDLAHGSIRTLADARAHALSHPRCQRAFGAALSATSPKASPFAGRPRTDVPGATPGLRPDDTLPFSGREVPRAPAAVGPGSVVDQAVSDLERATAREEAFRVGDAKIRDLVDHEEAYAIDDFGRTVLEKLGTGKTSRVAGSVEFTPDEIRRLAGTILTHNHPQAWQDGLIHATSFSPDDVGLYFYSKARQFRIVGKEADYSFEAPHDLGDAITVRFRRAWSEVYSAVAQSVRDELAEARTLSQTGGHFDMLEYGRREKAIYERASRLHAQRAMQLTIRDFPQIRYQASIRV